jgi:hypothetical protein
MALLFRLQVSGAAKYGLNTTSSFHKPTFNRKTKQHCRKNKPQKSNERKHMKRDRTSLNAPSGSIACLANLWVDTRIQCYIQIDMGTAALTGSRAAVFRGYESSI